MDKTLTDNEIKKALECCKEDDCDNCPNNFGNCYANLAGYALDLINRLQAENERLTHITRNLIGEIKAEAYTEFAERLKEWFRKESEVYKLIDNRLKEMVGEDNDDARMESY